MSSMWFRAVFGEITRWAATSLLDRPGATNRSDVDLAGSQARRAVTAPGDPVARGARDRLDDSAIHAPRLRLGAHLGQAYDRRDDVEALVESGQGGLGLRAEPVAPTAGGMGTTSPILSSLPRDGV